MEKTSPDRGVWWFSHASREWICPPCSGDCDQGRRCPSKGDPEADRRTVWLVMALLGTFWAVVAALVAVFA